MTNRSLSIFHNAVTQEIPDEPGFTGIFTWTYRDENNPRLMFLAKISPDGKLFLPFRGHNIVFDIGEFCTFLSAESADQTEFAIGES